MSSSGSQKNSINKEKTTPKLPWWVELLFVQIGLPDKWLPKILKTKNDTQKVLGKNKNLIFKSLIVLIGLIYLYPHTKYYRVQNICVESQKELLSQDPLNEKISRKLLTTKAVQQCNG